MPESDVSVEIDDRVMLARPDYRCVVVLATGMGNAGSDEASSALLADAEQQLRGRGLARASDDPHIAAWRSAFSAFGAKPSKYPCSAEALAARVLKGGALPRINVLVDLYNAVSIRYLMPIGGEDLERLAGTLRLTIADGSERFDSAEAEPLRPGEIVWRDDIGVTCRRWNWRQGTRTRLTETSTSGFFVFDRLGGLDVERLDEAASDLEAGLRQRWPHAAIERRRVDRAETRAL